MNLYQHHDEVAQRPHRLDHDLEGVVERLPRLGQLEHPEEAERPEHGEALDPLRQELHEREDDDEKVENVPAILRDKCYLDLSFGPHATGGRYYPRYFKLHR